MNKCIICGNNIETLQDENAVTYKKQNGFMCEKCFIKDTKKEVITQIKRHLKGISAAVEKLEKE